jgi:hypothetical protein
MNPSLPASPSGRATRPVLLDPPPAAAPSALIVVHRPQAPSDSRFSQRVYAELLIGQRDQRDEPGRTRNRGHDEAICLLTHQQITTKQLCLFSARSQPEHLERQIDATCSDPQVACQLLVSGAWGPLE